jgi:hypothetical protein
MKEYGEPLGDLPLFRSRRNDRPTSAAAAAGLPRITAAHSLLLAAYLEAGASGLTDEEAARAAGVDTGSCWWKRCGELRAAGAIVETGKTRMGSRGRARIVCRAATEAP